MDLPLFKKNEFYPMIWGIRETEIPMGMRSVGTGNVYYVDYDHNLANDDNTGVDPDNPLKTIQAAVDRVDDYDFIVVRSIDPSGEQVVTSGDADHVTIIGCGDSRYTPTWTAGTGEYCLVLNNDGWKVSGFRFLVPAPSIALAGGIGVVVTGDMNIITGNYFDGGTVGAEGIYTSGSDTWVMDNFFSLFHSTAGSVAINASTDGTKLFVINNVFMDNDNHIVSLKPESFITGNTIQQVGYAYTATVSLDTSDATNSIVSRNVFGGDYSIAGGFEGDATDMWVGNISDDIAETEVADNGFTVAIPAA